MPTPRRKMNRGLVAGCITALLVVGYFLLPLIVWFVLAMLTGLAIAIMSGWTQ